MLPREQILRRRVLTCTWLIILGLLIGGLTAIPLQTELDTVVRVLHIEELSPAQASNNFVKWILLVREALHETYAKYPFIGYGTDWLAFGHLVIAIAFMGCLRHPMRNIWLFQFGMIACVLVIPWALFFGELRGIPVYWRLIDSSFGVLGFFPCWLANRWTRELGVMRAAVFGAD
jgi:hypothetical protein